MHRTLFLFILSFITFFGFTQEKLFNIEEAVIGQWKNLYPQYMPNLQWRGETKNITFQDYTNVYQQTIGSADSITIITLDELNKYLVSADLDSMQTIPTIIWENENEFHFYNLNTWSCVSLESKKVISSIKLPAEAKNQSLWFNSKTIAYTLNNNLFIMGTDNSAISITTDLNPDIVNGQSVSRNEFGINGGIFWSPKGNLIAYYRKDESKVKNYPLVDITAREAELKNIKYPMAGMASEHISLGVFNLATKETVFIEANDTVSEKYLTNISWDPEEENIYIQVLNRAQNYMKLNKYSAANGKLTATLFEEKHDKYVEPHSPLIFLENKKDQFIYQTRTHGYNHAYLYNTNGELLKQITKGKWEITEIVHVKKDILFYISTEACPIERQLYKISINSGKKKKLTQAQGVHKITIHKNERYFIDEYSNTKTPRIIDILSTGGKLQRRVITAANPLKEYKMPEMEIGTIKSADSTTDLYYRLIKPVNFDSTKKYPAIVYVYGGPHAQLIENSWLGGARMWNYMMAQKGYVMLTIDNRGSANRGLEFENVIHRQCGVNEAKDQMMGIEFLKKTGFVDSEKIGVHGWSYGGFMTTTLMTNHPETFKVGVAGGPVIDWKYYEIMYGERYMDTPEENPDGYIYTSLIHRASNLKGKLLIIHGGIDPTVVVQHSQQFVRECIKNRVPIDYFIYPRAEHNVRGYDRIHLMDKVTQYFDDYLK
ncbi:MAG: DPP IV N-terminal domain-containing protein [Salinivirgaceae bacterium]|jgi:dipeptidyl-peptidase-4|nr:DPP IV N-terminal domain-containing protein [Salinivirgaceae bacterium]